MSPPIEASARRLRWSAACRIVPTRYPSVFLYDRVADAQDFEALYALEAMTNDRVRDEAGEIELVAPGDRIFGPGSGPIMAAFTHVNPDGSRFSDGSYGMFYAGRERRTGIAETQYHLSRFLAATGEAAMHLQMRLYHVAIDARLHDLRGPGPALAALHDPDRYAAPRAAGATLRAAGSLGVVYRSVRDPRGECVGLFKPRAASGCVHAAHLLYAWDGKSFTDTYARLP